jgi:hypothetical protein
LTVTGIFTEAPLPLANVTVQDPRAAGVIVALNSCEPVDTGAETLIIRLPPDPQSSVSVTVVPIGATVNVNVCAEDVCVEKSTAVADGLTKLLESGPTGLPIFALLEHATIRLRAGIAKSVIFMHLISLNRGWRDAGKRRLGEFRLGQVSGADRSNETSVSALEN